MHRTWKGRCTAYSSRRSKAYKHIGKCGVADACLSTLFCPLEGKGRTLKIGKDKMLADFIEYGEQNKGNRG